MKLYKFSIFALALVAGVMSSCSDDKEDYQIGPQSPGAYFSNQANTTYVLDKNSSSVTVPVMRTSTDADQTVALVVSDASGLFRVPSSVSFAAGQNTANIVVSYDASTLEFDHPYSVSIQVAEADQTLYGNSEAEFVFVVKSPVIELPGTSGTYYYSQYWSGADPDLPVSIAYNESAPDQKIYTIHNWGMDLDFVLNVDESVKDDYGCYTVHWEPFAIDEYEHSDGQVYTVYCEELYTYTGDEQYADASYFDPETGLFSLCLIYCVEIGRFGYGYEYFQLDGYPDYSVAVEYSGLFTTPKDVSYAIGSVTVGVDCEDALVANIEGDDVNSAIAQMVSGEIETVTLGPGQDQEVRFEVPGPGKYTMIAITRAKGELQNLAQATYTVKGTAGGGEDDGMEWEFVGYAPYLDGWIMPGFGVNPFDYAADYYVEIEQSAKDPAWIRMVNPYVNELFADLNENTEPANIMIWIGDPDCCFVQPQYSGFTYSGTQWGDDWYVGDVMGYYMVAGLEFEDGKDRVIANEINSIFDGDTFSVQYPVFGGDSSDTYGYTWNDIYPVEIYFSDMVVPQSQKPALAKAAARRNLSGVVPSILKATQGKYARKQVMRYGQPSAHDLQSVCNINRMR